MHDEEGWFVEAGVDLLLVELLVVAEEVGGQHHVAGLVHAMHVAEGGRDGEHWADLGQGVVHFIDLK